MPAQPTAVAVAVAQNPPLLLATGTMAWTQPRDGIPSTVEISPLPLPLRRSPPAAIYLPFGGR